jgi:hypothetical protein
MIPTVEDILLQLARKEISHEQAMAWMAQHFVMAEEEASARSHEVPKHVCGLQGFGADGDVCPACTSPRSSIDAHTDGLWCANLRCQKCYSAETWVKSQAAPSATRRIDPMDLLGHWELAVNTYNEERAKGRAESYAMREAFIVVTDRILNGTSDGGSAK